MNAVAPRIPIVRTAPIRARAARFAIAAIVVAFALLPLLLKSYGVYLCTLFCVTLMATYGLNLTVGYAGQMSLGQAAFYGIGAYIAAIALKAGRAPVGGDCLLHRGARARLSGAARPAPLSRIRHAGVQHPRLPRDA